MGLFFPYWVIDWSRCAPGGPSVSSVEFCVGSGERQDRLGAIRIAPKLIDQSPLHE